MILGGFLRRLPKELGIMFYDVLSFSGHTLYGFSKDKVLKSSGKLLNHITNRWFSRYQASQVTHLNKPFILVVFGRE